MEVQLAHHRHTSVAYDLAGFFTMAAAVVAEFDRMCETVGIGTITEDETLRTDVLARLIFERTTEESYYDFDEVTDAIKALWAKAEAEADARPLAVAA